MLAFLYYCPVNNWSPSKMRQHICASHRSINVHRIHISKAGADLHPVFMDAQNVIFLKVQR